MCLKINGDKFSEDSFLLAKEDITCYKVYILRNGLWETPYDRIKAPALGEVRQSKQPFVDKYIYVTNMMTSDGIHSFATEDGAWALANIIAESQPVRIVLSVIPQGSLYLSGTFIGYSSYASQFLIDKKVIANIGFNKLDVLCV